MTLGRKRFRAIGIAATAEIFAVNRIRDLNEGTSAIVYDHLFQQD
ncbi:hypothetical protein [Rhodococcus sp. C3V]|nr:hypothetical protein [Rhodococcus sp. C3V]MDF3319603.1 hypothetical protein [Rhodococcus sp. C3V]